MMKAVRVSLYAMLITAAAPVFAAEGYRHRPSGVSLPLTLGGVPQSDLRDPFGDGRDVQIGFSGGEIGTTIYIYRATQPNAALWFERAESTLTAAGNERGGDPVGSARAVSIGSPRNGLMRVYAGRGGATRSTALVVLQAGEWMVKLRASSSVLDPATLTARVDAMLATLTLPAFATPHPLGLPQSCADKMRTGITGADASVEAVASALAVGSTIRAGLHGAAGSLAATPERYCRVSDKRLSSLSAAYRPIDREAGEWEILFADSGRSFSVRRLPNQGIYRLSAVYVNDLLSSQVAMLFQGTPRVELVELFGRIVLLQQRPGLGEVQPAETLVPDSVPPEAATTAS